MESCYEISEFGIVSSAKLSEEVIESVLNAMCCNSDPAYSHACKFAFPSHAFAWHLPAYKVFFLMNFYSCYIGLIEIDSVPNITKSSIHSYRTVFLVEG